MKDKKEIENKINQLKNYMYEAEQHIAGNEFEHEDIERYCKYKPFILEEIKTLEWVLNENELI